MGGSSENSLGFWMGGGKSLGYSVSIEIDLVFSVCSIRPDFSVGIRIYLFGVWASKTAWFWDLDRNGLGLCVMFDRK